MFFPFLDVIWPRRFQKVKNIPLFGEKNFGNIPFSANLPFYLGNSTVFHGRTEKKTNHLSTGNKSMRNHVLRRVDKNQRSVFSQSVQILLTFSSLCIIEWKNSPRAHTWLYAEVDDWSIGIVRTPLPLQGIEEWWVGHPLFKVIDLSACWTSFKIFREIVIFYLHTSRHLKLREA